MSSTRPPAVRVSARQSAMHQQQLQQQQEQEQLRRQAQRERESTRASRSINDYNLDQSSRSLSPALSESPSLSGSDHPHQTNNANESATEQFSDPELSSYWETALVYGFLIKFRTLLQQNCPLCEFSIEASIRFQHGQHGCRFATNHRCSRLTKRTNNDLWSI